MAEEKPDPSGQTEKPTPHRLEKARKKGQIAQSREVGHFVMLGLVCLMLASLGDLFAHAMRSLLKGWLHTLGDQVVDGASVLQGARYLVVGTGRLSALFFGALMLGGMISTGLQTRLRLNLKALKPEWSRVSLKAGWGRIFSKKGGFDFLTNLGKLTVTLGLATALFRAHAPSVGPLSGIAVEAVTPVIGQMVLRMLLSLVVAMAILAALDYGYQWFQHFRSLYMSRQEVKDEFKEQEGDPHVTARQRQMQRETSQMKVLPEQVAEATVVITNPTHFAVALKWDPHHVKTPRVVAKGVDRSARRIRDLAQENFVPRVENAPLARVLFYTLKVGDEILPQHYKAVAEVIRYVMKIKNPAAADR